MVRSLRHQAPPWHSTSRKIAEEVRQRIRRERQYEEAQVSSAFRNGMWAWLDGQLMSACLLPAAFIDGARVTTIEGIAPDEQHLSPLQDTFIRHGGFQCGICTPGQVVAATALLQEHPRPTTDEVKRWMMGNLCRCTGYYKIVAAILAAAESPTPPPPREPVGVR